MDKNYVEQYLISIYEIASGLTSYILVPSNKAFSHLLANLDSNLYLIITIASLGNVISYTEFIKKITIASKPKDLEFGAGEDNV